MNVENVKRCVKCKTALHLVATVAGMSLFHTCLNDKCERFGLVTVVTENKKKK